MKPSTAPVLGFTALPASALSVDALRPQQIERAV
jgi:hypothetical protein